ncbi:hypothetical protein C8Q75DRAFT_20183 [Abortiporus biennis]|nr:hypothetical protein C8Q75DRAFT_20183 [Abortiporus biennis]
MPTDDMSFSPESAAALPQELAEQIIDYLHHDNDRQSVLACSLLSYPFLFAARHRLFDKVAIDWGYAKSAKNGIRDVQSFLENIQIRFLTLKLQNTVPQSAICRLLLACQISLKCLTIIVDDEWNKILETETLPLKNCVNLDTFVISSRTFLHHRRIDAWANFLTRVSACPKVRKIQIQWRFSPNIVWSDIPTILSYFPLAEWAWLDDSMKSYQNLQEVVLDISGLNDDAIDALQNHFSHFSSLSIVTLGLLKIKSGLNLDGDMEDFEHHPS